MKLRRQAGLLVTITATVPLALVGCSKIRDQVAPPPKLAVTPAVNAKEVPTSAEIGMTVTGGKISSVTLTDDKGTKIDGAMREDGSSWIPNAPLKNKQAYTVKVTAAGPAGKSSTQTTNFTTMDKPTKQTRTTLNVKKDQTYGVAMPVTIEFDPGVPKEARADVQKRLFVSTEPRQPGAWHWTDDGKQVFYRAPDLWQAGTKISVRAAAGGLPVGKGSYGDADRTATAKIGKNVSLDIDDNTKQMSVFKDDKLIRKIPVSLGKDGTPTSSGKMVIMEKFDSTVFDTTGSLDPYVVTVADAQRLTWGGEFIHSAPWSVGSQGYANTSHGCTNVAPEDADWLMGVTHVGDLVTVKGTGVKLDDGNGWTAWNMSWDEYVKGSALPVPADLKPAEAKPAVPPASGAPAAVPPASGAPAVAPSKSGR